MQGNKTFTIVVKIVGILVGLLFIFSGLIKANDPSGLAYKMGEFYEVWAREGYWPKFMMWLNEYTLVSAIIMIAFEIIAGVALIIGYRFNLFSFLIFLLTLFFTFLTGYALFSGHIKECGCFGDCIKLQANESFMKDLILLVLTGLLVVFRKQMISSVNSKLANVLMIFSIIFSVGIQLYALKHLPFKDCLPYKAGNNLAQLMTPGPDYIPAVFKSVLVYEKNGQKQEFTADNFPWQDSTWKFVDNKTIEVSPAKNEPPIKDFTLTSFDGEDVTQALITYPGQVFLLFVKDVREANAGNMEKLRKLIQTCKTNHVPFVGLTSSDDITTAKFKQTHQLDIDFYTIDGTVCKTAMRSNPGLMLLQNGVVKHKWSYADYPVLETLGLDYKLNQQPLLQPNNQAQPSANVDSTIQL